MKSRVPISTLFHIVCHGSPSGSCCRALSLCVRGRLVALFVSLFSSSINRSLIEEFRGVVTDRSTHHYCWTNHRRNIEVINIPSRTCVTHQSFFKASFTSFPGEGESRQNEWDREDGSGNTPGVDSGSHWVPDLRDLPADLGEARRGRLRICE